jgi:hypothetical protein
LSFIFFLSKWFLIPPLLVIHMSYVYHVLPQVRSLMRPDPIYLYDAIK